jgi:hypothetical protein
MSISPVVTAVDLVMIDSKSCGLNDYIVNHADSTINDLFLRDVFAPENHRLWESLALPNVRALLLVEDRGESSASPAAHVQLLGLLVDVIVHNL